MKKESRKMADAAVKEYNKILNLLDPPKDMNDGYTGGKIPDAADDTLKTYLIELFWPGYNTATKKPTLPTGFVAVGDTKNAIKRALGAEGVPGKPFSDYIAEKANRLRILRETHSTGEDGRPSGLFIAQDSGPGVEKLVKGGHIIITPGTIMDPASKTKAAGAGDDFDVTNFVTLGKYTSLPSEFISQLNMEAIITGEVTMVNAAPNYHVTIPYKFGDAAADRGTIDAYLKHSDFKKATDVGPNNDGEFFLGNDTKNSYISSNYNKPAEKNTIKKYILVKELGDTLQVSWLKYIMKTSDDAKTALDGAGDAPSAAIRAAASNNPYTSDKTAIITGDTVVWYRSMVNKVPVFLTWKGETNFWRASDNDTFMVAAMKKTIREQLISDNQAVIEIIKEISNTPLAGAKARWIWGLEWNNAQYTAAKAYLSKLAKKLENLNKDALIFVDNVIGIEETKDAAKKYHFNNPFVKKGDIWKTNDKVTSILSNGDIKFYASTFKTVSTFGQDKLDDARLFIQLPAAGGGQRGGARKTVDEKKVQAIGATTKSKQNKYYTDRIGEFTQADDVALPAEYSGEWTVITTRARAAKTKRETRTTAHDSVTKIKDFNIFSASSDGATPLKPNDNVLYLFVRDFFPEVFTYAAMMKQAFDDLMTETYTPGGDTTASRAAARAKRTAYAAMSAAFPDISLDLKTQYPLEYTFNERGQMNIEGSVAGTPAATLKATKQALYLAHKFITYYDFMPSKDLLTFVNYCVVGNTTILSTAEKETFDTALTEMVANNYAYVEAPLENQGGGGNFTFDPILSSAMDNYELYYSLYVQASYEDRRVTDMDFKRAILKNYMDMVMLEMKSAGISAENLSKLKMRTGKGPNNLALERAFPNPNDLRSNRLPQYLIGGKSKYKKTHKKRKSSRKLKTRTKKRV